MGVKFTYIALDYDRELDSPLTEQEFTGLRSDGDRFVDQFIDLKKKSIDPIGQLQAIYFNPRIKRAYLICLLLTGLYFSLALSDTIESNNLFDVLFGLMAFWVILQPLLYVRGYIKTIAEIGHLEITIRHYYKTQNTIVKRAKSFDDYMKIISSAN